jgi:hypothetical protein
MSLMIEWAGQRKGRESPEKFLAKAGAWLASTCARTLTGDPATVLDDPQGPVLFASLHPAAPVLELRCGPRSAVTASARTSGVGPGYHRHVESLLRLLGPALGVTWSGAARMTPRARVEKESLDWLSAAAAQCLEALDRDAGYVTLSMPAEPMFVHEGDVTTPLGPRDRRWLEKTARDGAAGVDVLPWWEDGPGAQQALGRALCLLWSDVRFRVPIDDEEQAVLAEVARLLAAAHDEDPSLEYPWAAWGELLDLQGEEGPIRAVVARHEPKGSKRRPPIGYRRGDVVIAPFAGWAVQLPGSLATMYEDDGRTFCGFEADRAVRVTSYTAPGERGAVDALLSLGLEDDQPAPRAKTPKARRVSSGKSRAPQGGATPAALPPGALPPGVLGHVGTGMRGWARLHELEDGGRMLEGHSATQGRLAVSSIAFADPTLVDWAVATWKSIQPLG